MGEKFGVYDLLRKVAQGGMAEVFLAERQGALGGFSQQVAIKRIYPHLAQDPELASMFFDEARIASKLHHPNIVQIYDLGQIEGFFYLAMEYVHGRDLRSICEQGIERDLFLPIPLAVRIIADAAAGLHFAHVQRDEHGQPMNIVHRDVSPQNILIGLNGGVKLCDFGIAKAEERITHTRTGQLKGKFGYMSPEQAAHGMSTLDGRSDVFSLGIVLYEITAITRLFRGKSDFDTIRMVTEQPIAPPSRVRSGYPLDLEAIVLKALQRDPAQRFQSAEQLQLALEDWLIEHRAKASSAHLAHYMRELLPEEASPAPEPPAATRHQAAAQPPAPSPTSSPTSSPASQLKPLAKLPSLSLGSPSQDRLGPRSSSQVSQVSSTKPSQAASASSAASAPKPALTALRLPQLERPLEEDTAPLMAALPEPPPAPGALADPAQEISAAQVVYQEALADEEYDDLEPTGEIKIGDMRAMLGSRDFSTQESSYPQRPDQTPLPRDRHMTPMGHHEVARATLGPQLQPSRSPQISGSHPAQARPPHLSGQHPTISRPPQPSGRFPAAVRTTGPHAVLPSTGFAGEPTLDLERRDDQDEPWHADAHASTELSFAKLQRRDRLKKALLASALLASCAGAVALFIQYGASRPVPPSDQPPKPVITEQDLEPEPLAPLARRPLQLTSSPEGASIILNGLDLGLKTPATVELASGRHNDLSVWAPGHSARRALLKPSFDEASLHIKLEPAAKPLPKARPTTLFIDTEPSGAQVTAAGQLLGTTPLTLDSVDPGGELHLTFSLQGHRPSVALFRPTAEGDNRLLMRLDPLELRSKKHEAELVLDVFPRGAQVSVDEAPVGLTLTRKTARRGALVVVELTHRDYEPMTRVFEIADFGTLSLRAMMTPLVRQRGRVTLRLPEDAKRVFIGSSSYAPSDLKRVELVEGSHDVTLELQDGRRAEGKLQVEPNAHATLRASIVNGKLSLAP